MAFDDYTKSNSHGYYYRDRGKRTTATGLNHPVIVTNEGGNSRIIPATDSVMGKKNPYYRQQIRDILSATTPCVGQKSSFSIKRVPNCALKATFGKGQSYQVVYDQTHLGFEDVIRNHVVSYKTTSASELTSAENRAIQKLYKELNSFNSAVKAGEDVGEIKQTLDAFRRPLPGLRNLVNQSFKNAKKAFSKSDAASIAKAAADTWLQFQFGYKPLESTIAGAVVGLSNRNIMSDYKPFHAHDFAVIGDIVKDSSIAPPGGNIAIKLVVQRQVRYDVTFQGIWAEECDIPQRSVAACLGLQGQDVLPTIWNLIPFSFLADYFTNVGDIVGAISVPWAGVRWCNKTVRSDFTNQIDQIYEQNFTASDRLQLIIQQWFPETGKLTSRRVSFVRSAQSTLPLPTLELTSPLDLSWRQYLNIAALTATMGFKLAALAMRSVARHPKLPSLFLKEMDRLPVGARPLKNEFNANRGIARGAR
jgi:hypothetical protein